MFDDARSGRSSIITCIGVKEQLGHCIRYDRKSTPIQLRLK
jgi:hypothetical protein